MRRCAKNDPTLPLPHCSIQGAEREELETAMEMSEQETAINDAIDRSLSSAQEQVEQATEEKVPPRLSPATPLPAGGKWPLTQPPC